MPQPEPRGCWSHPSPKGRMLLKPRESRCRLHRPITSSEWRNQSMFLCLGAVWICRNRFTRGVSLSGSGWSTQAFLLGRARSLWDCKGAYGNWPRVTVPVVSCCLHHICVSCVPARLQMMNNFASIQHCSSPRTYAAAATVPPTFLHSS